MNFDILLEKAIKAGISELELYTSYKQTTSITVFDDEVSEKELSETKVFCLRGIYNNQLATVYTEKDTDDEADKLIEQLKVNATYLTNDEPYFIYGGDKDYAKVDETPCDCLSVSTKDKINLLLSATSKLKSVAKKYFHGEVEYSETKGYVTIVNNNGLDVKKDFSYAVIFGQLVSKDGDNMKSAFKMEPVKSWNAFDLDKFVSQLVEKTESQFGAETIKSSSYKVVLENSVMCSIMSVFAGNYSAQSVKRKSSFLDGCLDKQVFGKNITIVDDPFYKDLLAIDTFDDEGVATKVNEVVVDGVLKTYLHNLSTASYYNTKSTGNGHKASVSSPVDIQPNCFCLKPGTKSFDELLEAVGDGVLITSVTGLHAGVNPISGDFNVQCSGYLIEKGKKSKAVTLIVLSGKYQDILNNIVEIGNDVECRGSMAMPSVYVKSMNISGC